MKVITAPEPVPSRADLFLGGGISGCPLWQDNVIRMLEDSDGIVLNPRRTGQFDLTGSDAGEQIEWEYHALRACDTVLFWFPEETLCPITLLELGVFTQRPQTRLIVGAHENYQRRFDVIKQLSLSRPEVKVHSSLSRVVDDFTSTRSS